MAAVALMGLWRETFWGPFEPRVLEIAREQYAGGSLFGVPTLSGMPFLEKPALPFSLLALSFHVAGGPSVLAARLVQGALLLVWIAATIAAARRVAGPRAGILAGCLLVTSPVFFSQAGRVSVDAPLAAAGALALLFLGRAASSDRGPLRAGSWLLGLSACGLAFLSKNVFGLFLVLGPLLVYALLSRDKRILRALFRPSSLAILVAPPLLWAAVLYAEGGSTYLFEAFVNNSLGRLLHIRFRVAGVESLPYGDVNAPDPWWFFPSRLGSLAGPGVLLLPFATVALLRAGVRRRGPRTRLAAMALAFGVVPPILLSFSSQKGVHHLGSCTTGFALLGALWLDRLLRRDRERAEGGLALAAAGIALLAPVFLIGTFFGFPGTQARFMVAAGAAVALAVPVLAVSLGRKRFSIAVACTLASVMTVVLLTRAPGRVDEDDLRFLDFPIALRARVGDHPLACHRLRDGDLGAFCWVLERELTVLRKGEDVARYLDEEGPRLCVVRGGAARKLPRSSSPTFVFAHGGNGSRVYTVLANETAIRNLLPPAK